MSGFPDACLGSRCPEAGHLLYLKKNQVNKNCDRYFWRKLRFYDIRSEDICSDDIHSEDFGYY